MCRSHPRAEPLEPRLVPAFPPALPTPRLVGYRDFAAGSDAGTAPVVRFFNPDATQRFAQAAFGGGFTGGVRVAVADFNRDGTPDVAVGTGPGSAPLVRVIDGITGLELVSFQPFEASFTGGVFLAAGDLNGDGAPELIVSPDQGGGPRVRVFDGGSIVLRAPVAMADFFGIDDPNFRGGARVAAADVNGDLASDLVVAAGFGGGPRVAVFDGRSVATSTPVRLVSDFFAFEPTLRNGAFVAAGDLNGDGQADLIFGGGPGGAPRVRVASSAVVLGAGPFGSLDNLPTAQLANFFAGDVNDRGGIRVTAADLDSDTRTDLIVGTGPGAGSRVTAFLGKNIPQQGTPTAQFQFDAFPGDTNGVFVG